MRKEQGNYQRRDLPALTANRTRVRRRRTCAPGSPNGVPWRNAMRRNGRCTVKAAAAQFDAQDYPSGRRDRGNTGPATDAERGIEQRRRRRFVGERRAARSAWRAGPAAPVTKPAGVLCALTKASCGARRKSFRAKNPRGAEGGGVERGNRGHVGFRHRPDAAAHWRRPPPPAFALPARQRKHRLETERTIDALAGRRGVEHRDEAAPRQLGTARFQNARADAPAAAACGDQHHADPGEIARR